MVSHTACVWKEYMIIFGGKEAPTDSDDEGNKRSKEEKCSNDVSFYNLNSKTWIQPKISGPLPTPRYGHTACMYKDYMIIDGGWSGRKVLKDTSVLDLSQGIIDAKYVSLKDIMPADHDNIKLRDEDRYCPPKRHFHSANIIGNKMYIFGGGDGKRWNKSLYILDLETSEWYKPRTNGLSPSGRLQHTSFVYQEKLYIFGGEPETPSLLNDMYCIDMDTFAWTRIDLGSLSLSTASIIPNSEDMKNKKLSVSITPRVASGSIVAKDHVFIFGGYDGGKWLNDFLAINLNTHETKMVNYAEEVQSRCRHSMILHKAEDKCNAVIYGGTDGNKVLSDVCSIEIPDDLESKTREENETAQNDVEDKNSQTSDNQTEKQDYSSLFGDKKYADLAFKVKDEYIPAHSVICAIKSPFLKDKIDSSFAASENSGRNLSSSSKSLIDMIPIIPAETETCDQSLNDIGEKLNKENGEEQDEHNVDDKKESLCDGYLKTKKIVEINEFSGETLKNILEYIYGKETTLSSKAALELIIQEDSSLNIKDLTLKAEKQVSELFTPKEDNTTNTPSDIIQLISEDMNISVTHILKLHSLAEKCNNADLKQQLLLYMTQNFELKKK
ncbi:unnamed protein product [Moneuplotes crassus]|uniref:BTB domain-containing protein n=1 Tax=Euplotes crassus TaxID=5936 RepID=A0AAD1U837_EUPCR|nr:unnamed protein product [Moneuplotes crassus]